MTADRRDEYVGSDAAAAEEVAGDGEQPRPAEGAGPEPQGEGEGSGAAGAGGEGAASEELEELRDRYLRLAAEYENYRRRTERERSESWVKAQAQIVGKLLDSLDDLQRVAHFNAETTTVPALLEGVQMVERKLLRVLEMAGLEAVDAKGQTFNPVEHEALMTAAAEDPDEDDTVGEVFQKGYRFKGDLLRPARVQVRKHGG